MKQKLFTFSVLPIAICMLTANLFLPTFSFAQTQLWGMTSKGGQYAAGTIFKTDGSGNNETVQQSYFQVEGANPLGSLLQASDGKIYGMTYGGGVDSLGVLFQYDPATSTYTKKFDFTGTANGSNPYGSLIQASDGKIYGMTYAGGVNNLGVLFQFDPATSSYTKKLDFNGTTNGSHPYGSLMQASNGKIYGMTAEGGANNLGVLFQYDPSTSIYTKKIDFAGATNGGNPTDSLMEASDGMLYGLTQTGGANDMGVLFQFDPTTSTYIKKVDFDGAASGSYPLGSLMQALDGKLYGLTFQGGANDMGVLFQFEPGASTYYKHLDFNGAANGSYPAGSLMQASDGKLYGMTEQGGVYNMGVVFQFNPADSTYSKKLDFSGTTNGSYPDGSLIQASDGKIYGMANGGGKNDKGLLFQFNPSTSAYTKKVDFGEAINGKYPDGSLMQASDGKLYGLTYGGGTNSLGVLFQYDPTTSVYSKKLDFAGLTNGSNPCGSLIQASDGKLYGMAYQGGADSLGVLFQFDPVTFAYTKKLDFNGANGAYPFGSLMQASDGMLYGMTLGGGTDSLGVLFQYDPATSTYTKKLDFTGSANGSYPLGVLVQAANGKLYGMTSQGGVNNMGVLFQFDPATSTYTKKLDFSGSTNGRSPNGSLMQATDGKLYGMTNQGGVTNLGVLFQFDPATSTYIKKLDFSGTTNGSYPNGTLMQASDGNLYGMTLKGGVNDMGVLFKFDPATSAYTNKLDFDGANGKNPYGNLIEIAVSISTASLSTTINTNTCVNTSINVPYTITGAYDAGNVFTAQLSDASGSFASASAIGSVTSVLTGTISATIPSNTPAGTGYRIRVVSSTPVITGSDNGSNISVIPLAAPIVSSPVNYCQNSTASPLTATGTALLWYTVASGGTGSSTAPTPSTSVIGSVDYYVSQTVNSCESPLALITVNTTVSTAAPTVSTPVSYCQNDIASPLAATGTSLLWYTAATGGTGSSTAPIPSTLIDSSYYVSQTQCGEGPRAVINVTIIPLPVVIVNSLTICVGQTATLTASGASSYLWSTTSSGGSITVSPTTPTSYTVTGTTASCSASTVGTITVNPLPTVSINLSTIDTVCKSVGIVNLTGGSPIGGTYSGTGVTGSTFNAGTAAGGNYTISYTYTDGNSCSNLATGNIYVNLCLEINELNKVIDVTISPNPFTSHCTITFTEEQKNTSIKIMDVLGKEIKTINYTGKQLLLEKGEMQEGVYFVQIIDENKNVVNKKIVVE